MKKLFLLLITLCGFTFLSSIQSNSTDVSTTTVVNVDEYCKGWEDGYCEGWRDVKGQNAICPITPICPIPEINKDRYTDGYNRGFKRGIRDASK